MVESAAHLVDHVFPEAPVRQWVLTFPFPLRFLLAAQPRVLTEVLAVVQRGISTFLIRRAGFTVASGASTGAVTLIQPRSDSGCIHQLPDCDRSARGSQGTDSLQSTAAGGGANHSDVGANVWL
jgi:hypothetical protein